MQVSDGKQTQSCEKPVVMERRMAEVAGGLMSIELMMKAGMKKNRGSFQ